MALREGQILTGSMFSTPMRRETVRANGRDTWVAARTRCGVLRQTPVCDIPDSSGLFWWAGCNPSRGKYQASHSEAAPPTQCVLGSTAPRERARSILGTEDTT